MSKLIYIDGEPVVWPHDTITVGELKELSRQVNEKRQGEPMNLSDADGEVRPIYMDDDDDH